MTCSLGFLVENGTFCLNNLEDKCLDTQPQQQEFMNLPYQIAFFVI